MSVRTFFGSLAKLPLELLRILLLLLLLLLWIIWTLILFLLLRKWRGKGHGRKCPGDIPPHVRRKPDPCLYSQFYLMQQNVPVTWDNPDIFLTELDGVTQVPSSQLQPSHPYIVHGRIWDASFEPALAVEVRCYFQDWGVNAPRTPVELNANGTERVVLLNIAPWGNAVAQFKWTTPAAGHYCLKVECSHPDDKNPANNVGQENTDVIGAAPGQLVTAMAQIINPVQHPLAVTFAADTYRIPEESWEFPLVTRTRRVGEVARAGRGPEGLHSERRGASFSQWLWGWGRGPTSVVYNYVGRKKLLQAQREAPSAIPPGWGATVDGQDLKTPLLLGAGERRDVELALQVPAGAQPGQELTFNFNAVAPERGPLGGVTVTVKVQ